MYYITQIQCLNICVVLNKKKKKMKKQVDFFNHFCTQINNNFASENVKKKKPTNLGVLLLMLIWTKCDKDKRKSVLTQDASIYSDNS